MTKTNYTTNSVQFEHISTTKIQLLNDTFRKTFIGGTVYITPAIQRLNEINKFNLIKSVKEFNDFNPDNDPYNEHDFGQIILNDTKYFWKIDYYDNQLENGSEDPSNPEITKRVLISVQIIKKTN
tara:strand:- start:184 stop:558 length:375 start_codon:yes stop_codon:yes gene_type:complete